MEFGGLQAKGQKCGFGWIWTVISNCSASDLRGFERLLYG